MTQRRPPVLSTHGRRSTSIQASAIMTHRKLAAVLAAVLFAGSASTALAQRRRWRSFSRYRRGRYWPHFHHADAGYRNGRRSRHWHDADPRYRNRHLAQHYANAWDRNDPESRRHTHRRASKQRASGREIFERQAFERQASEPRTGPHPRGHQGGNRGRYHLPTMSRQRQISERAADVPWSSGISVLSAVPHAETALVPPGPT